MNVIPAMEALRQLDEAIRMTPESAERARFKSVAQLLRRAMQCRGVFVGGHEEITKEELAELFREEVRRRATEVDPDREHHWGTLTYGWAIGKGLEPAEALDFAHFIRYNTDLG